MFKLTLVTPEKKLVMDQEVEAVVVPANRGELNILAGHTPLITTLETGIVKWKEKGKDTFHHAVVSWGYCQIFPGGVDILAEVADLPSEVDVEECKRYITEGEKRLNNEVLNDETFELVSREIKRMRADLEISKLKH